MYSLSTWFTHYYCLLLYTHPLLRDSITNSNTSIHQIHIPIPIRWTLSNMIASARVNIPDPTFSTAATTPTHTHPFFIMAKTRNTRSSSDESPSSETGQFAADDEDASPVVPTITQLSQSPAAESTPPPSSHSTRRRTPRYNNPIDPATSTVKPPSATTQDMEQPSINDAMATEGSETEVCFFFHFPDYLLP